MPELTLYNLNYTKADLDAAPAAERLLFLMGASVVNDTQMLNKMLMLSLERTEGEHRIVNQGNSSQAFMILRMLTGRLNEAWKMLAKFSRMVKADYLNDLSEDAQRGFRAILSYFGGRQSLILAVRDGVAFHHLQEHVEAAYETLDPSTELGDYMNRSIGNTLYFTTEILQYETLKNLAGTRDHMEAIHLLIRDTREQTSNFNSFLFGYTLTFAERHLRSALVRLKDDSETFIVPRFDELSLPFFSELPSTS